MVHGVEPVLLFNLTEAMYLSPPLNDNVSTTELLALHGRQLMKYEEDLELMGQCVLQAPFLSMKDFEQRFMHTIKDFKFKAENLVLVCNTSIEQEVSRKLKPQYLGPMVVVRQTVGGSFILSELDGSASTMHFAAF